jgi:hypothetical protein
LTGEIQFVQVVLPTENHNVGSNFLDLGSLVEKPPLRVSIFLVAPDGWVEIDLGTPRLVSA